jgi:hypothetical protein
VREKPRLFLLLASSVVVLGAVGGGALIGRATRGSADPSAQVAHDHAALRNAMTFTTKPVPAR